MLKVDYKNLNDKVTVNTGIISSIDDRVEHNEAAVPALDRKITSYVNQI